MSRHLINFSFQTFWDHVNLILNDILLTNKREEKVSWQSNVENNLPDCKNPELFSIWLIYHMTLLYGYSNDGFYLNCRSTRVILINLSIELK